MLKPFGHDTVCIDGTNVYHFNLVTLVVIHGYGKGIPVVSIFFTSLMTEILRKSFVPGTQMEHEEKH